MRSIPYAFLKQRRAIWPALTMTSPLIVQQVSLKILTWA
jgi:hypothetical protein